MPANSVCMYLFIYLPFVSLRQDLIWYLTQFCLGLPNAEISVV